jgi:threonine dehydrogenase-like Zn-dependent dehydrogenase
MPADQAQSMKTSAMVQVGVRKLEVRELEVPRIGADEALLRVEACGLCGSDISQYRGTSAYLGDDRYPMIPGHEAVGVIEEIGSDAARRWHIASGDRVAVVPHDICGRCPYCLAGNHHLCKGELPVPRAVYGYMPLSFRHGLWGGYSRHMVLHARTQLCKIPDAVPFRFATLYQALAAGLRWAVDVPRTRPNDTVLVLGCGQRGLASVVALRAAGVRDIIVTGLARDRFKLDLAMTLGAKHVVAVDEESTVERVLAYTNGRGVDVALDLVPHATQSVLDAIEALVVGGTLVIAGIKGNEGIAALHVDRILYKELTIRGVFTQGVEFYHRAIDLLARDLATAARIHTDELPLADVAEAIERLSGERPGAETVSISVHPWMTNRA